MIATCIPNSTAMAQKSVIATMFRVLGKEEEEAEEEEAERRGGRRRRRRSIYLLCYRWITLF